MTTWRDVICSSRGRVCVRCIMDESDPEIWFDDRGVCSHCYRFENDIRPYWFPNEDGRQRMELVAAQIRAEGAGREYDSILGLSGGADSSYVAYQAAKLGLRPLVVHVDAGWNSELAVKNIEHIVKKLSFDLHTEVIDWDEMRDLQLAFLRSGVANQDTPQDHVFFATLYGYAVRHGIRYVLSGSNLSTESIFPDAWQHDAMDRTQLLAIHRRFGRRKLEHYSTVGFFRLYVYFPMIRRMKVVKLLNLQPYHRLQAIAILQHELGWRDYGAKHCESRFTKFFQRYFLPCRFGYDKRIAHLSTMIVTGQLTRQEAIDQRARDIYPEADLQADREYVVKKLGVSRDEFESFLTMPLRSYSEYRSNARLHAMAAFARSRYMRLRDGVGGTKRPPPLEIDARQSMPEYERIFGASKERVVP